MATISISSLNPSPSPTSINNSHSTSVTRRNTLSKVKKFFSSNKNSTNNGKDDLVSVQPSNVTNSEKPTKLTKINVSRNPSNKINRSIATHNNTLSPTTSEKQMSSPVSSIHSSSNITELESPLSPSSSKLNDFQSPLKLCNNSSTKLYTSNIAPTNNGCHGSSNSTLSSSMKSNISLDKLNPTIASRNEKKSNNTLVSPIVSNSNISALSINTTTSNATCNKRFIVFENGAHEHHLKIAKRQEKLSTMLKNIMGSQKLRNEARSAVPDIITDPLNNNNKESSTSKPSTTTNCPPTLMSGFVKQMENHIIDGLNSTSTTTNSNQTQEQTLHSFSDSTKHSVSVSKQKDSLSFVEKYGHCQEVLGKGAFGVVRICHKKSANKKDLESLYAVKEFKKRNNESSEKYSKRLTAEFCISSSLHHPNIVATLDLFQDAKGDYCEVMEYCAGGDLFTLIIASGKLEYMEADCFFKQLIKGVVYMHDVGVCHRDLKPENLLLTSNGILKITDFGNSECFKMAWEKDIYLSGGICGSTPYIAPEEYTQEEFDPRPVDIWACGVIYMAMRTGRQLWNTAKKDDKFYLKYLKARKEKDGYEPIENLKRARCRNVIYSMLDPVPHRRITGKQILNSEWGREIKCCSDKLRK